MVFTMRIYRMHDLDIIMLLKASDIAFGKTLKQVLKSYIQGNVYRIDVSGHWKDIEPRDLPNEVFYGLKLNEEKDADIIQLLNQMTDGYKNSFIKHVLRMYTEPFALSCFYSDKESMRLPINALQSVKTVQPYVKGQKKPKQNMKDMDLTTMTDMVLNETKIQQPEQQVQTQIIPPSPTVPIQEQVSSPVPQQNVMPVIKNDVSQETIQKPVEIKPIETAPVNMSIEPPVQQTETGTEQTTADAADFFGNLMNNW